VNEAFFVAENEKTMYNFFKKFSKTFEFAISLFVTIFSGSMILGGVFSYFQRDTSKKHLSNGGYLVFGFVLLIIFLSGIFTIYKRLRSK
jgi:hypothetical protein